MRKLGLAALLLLSACGAPTVGHQATTPPPVAPVAVEIIAINDFHGYLEPPRGTVDAPADAAEDSGGSGGFVAVPAGGAAWLAATIDAIRAQHANAVVVAAGDIVSASPLVSAFYLDEPTIAVMNRIGLELSSVGNHEFDRGRDELLRLQNGGCAKFTQRQPCRLEPFTGAKFQYLAANVLEADGSALFPATALRHFGTGAGAVTVGFVGLTLRDTATMVSPAGIQGLSFGDEADAINAAVPRLKAAGADAVVVLIHQGGKQTVTPHDPDGCKDFTGDILPILARLDPRVDLVVSGHTHNDYVCDYGATDPTRPFLLTSAGHYGEFVTDIALTIDPARHRVITKSAHNLVVQSPGYTASGKSVTETPAYPQRQPRADIAQYVARYADAIAEFAARPIGRLSGTAAKPGGDTSAIGGAEGYLVADSYLAATKVAGARIAFTNPGGIRFAIEPAADHTVSFAQISRTLPFDNTLVTGTMTGAEIKATLEHGVESDAAAELLSPSAGFAYTIDRARPAGSRIVGMTFDGKAIDPAANYRVTTNSFLANGGSGYPFAVLRDRVVGMGDVDALAAWLAGNVPRAVPAEERVKIGS